ncbi:hypothetical protein EDC01DRAFT_98997 [Geopyxis carbonaria]|nr:hypothetical protein EDC01DRAFT_98997 [Geopyxis carbonaria]
MNNYEYPFPAGTVPVPVVNTLQSCVNTGDSNWPYFLDGTGIEHHVIQTDIPRYLGNDAQVKRGTHQGVDGFKFSGYRPLTSAMIRSLREDSSKWLKERQDYWRQTNQSGPNYYKSRTYDESLIRSPPVNYQQNQPPPASRATRGGGPPGDPGIPPSAPMGHGYQDAARYHGQQYEGRSGYPEPPYVDTYGRGGGSHKDIGPWTPTPESKNGTGKGNRQTMIKPQPQGLDLSSRGTPG